VAGEIDFEQKSTYNLIVRVTDDGTTARTATTNVTITVTDESDEPPTCTTKSVSKSIPENTTVPSLVSDVFIIYIHSICLLLTV